ncbi:unnamed protein product [Medioppia subpectinata]|uniref:Uncharacterized protein n=1 Tax=Medioppia subpectinata TaxID=1979941 RepID=A0A7R9KFN0_9ACAR|nr:unnamed protein product [Medioppia subpectinata]CAG2101325.1 unnamed protein product [Medioppia subpectinata]
MLVYDGSQLARADADVFAKQFCNPDKTNSAIVTKVVECDTNFKKAVSQEVRTLGEKLDKATNTLCLKKAGDMSVYKKVDLTKAPLKEMLIEMCDADFNNCVKKLIETDSKISDDMKKLAKLKDQKEYDKYEKCTMDAAPPNEKLLVDKILHDKCLGKAGDMSKFKKVDLTKADLKTMLIEVCDDGYLKCHDALMDSDKKVHDDLDKIDHLTDSKEYKKLEKCDYAAIKK